MIRRYDRSQKKRYPAAGSLFYAYLQKEEYEKAQSYLSYLAVDSPERKRKEALIC